MALTPETKVGLFTLAGLGVLGFGILVLGDIQFRGTYPLYVYFNNADGLPEKGPVKVAGVEVGKVEEIRLTGQRAKVKVRVREDVAVHRGARAHVSSTGLIGSKYLEMDLGDPSAPVLQRGETVEGVESLSFDEVMAKLGEFLKDDPATGAMAENIRVTMANFRKVSQALADSLGRQQAEISDIVVNIRDASRHAKALAANLQEISDERKEDIKVALAKFRSVSERLDGILAKVEDGQGMLPKLLNDPKMGQELEKTMTNVNQASGDLKGFVGRIAAIKLYWDYRQRFDLEDDQWHPDLGVYMYPRPEKYYYVGGTNLGANQDWKDDPEADAERRNRITAILGHDFGPVTLYGGLIRSAGGAGLKFRPLPKGSPWHRRLELEAEAYDFGRDDTIQGGKLTLQGPVYNLGARVKAIDPWLWLGAQVEDAAERRNLTVNTNLVFRDEDLTFLLGLIGLAR